MTRIEKFMLTILIALTCPLCLPLVDEIEEVKDDAETD